MAFTKKLVALLLILALVVSVAACGAKTETPSTSGNDPAGNSEGASTGGADANEGRVLNILAMQDSGTLHPLGVTGGFITPLYGFYEPLYDTHTDGTRKWVLATGLDRVSDIQWTLTIREGVTFSNGNPLTAEDVMFSMELCADSPQFALNVKAVDFEKTSVVNDYTIDLWYTEYNASQEPGFASMLILDKESYDEVALSLTPIGTGPYVVTEYTVNSHLKMTARDDYWGDPVNIKDLHFKVINEEAQIVNALEMGELDIASIPLAEADFIEELGYEVSIYDAGYPYVTLFSCIPGTPLGTKEARWAVSHAIDRQAIVDMVLEGRAAISEYPGSNSMTDYESRFSFMHDTYATGYNVELAQQYADASGLTGKTIRLITNGAAVTNTIAEIIQGNLDAIGVTADIVNYDQATYFGTIMDASNFEIALFTPSAPSMLAVDVMAMYLTFIPLGWEGAERDAYGALSMGAISTYDETERGQKLYEALEIFVENDPWFALAELVMSRAQSADVTGVEYMTNGAIYYQYISFK